MSRALLCLVVVATACSNVDMESEVAALRAADSLSHALFMDGNAQRLMAVFGDNARNYPPGDPVEGGETIQLGFEDRFGGLGFELTRSGPTKIVLAGSGDLGYTVADEEMTFENENGELTTVKSRRLTIWKKAPDGRWLIAENMWNYGR